MIKEDSPLPEIDGALNKLNCIWHALQSTDLEYDDQRSIANVLYEAIKSLEPLRASIQQDKQEVRI